MKEKSNIFEIPRDKDYTMYPASNKQVQPANHIVIAESHPTNKKTISSARKFSCRKDTQTTKSSATLALGLTSKEKGLSSFWSNQHLEMSKKLWLPTETDSVGLDSNLLSGSSLNTMLNSWFSTTLKVPRKQNLLPTSSPYLPCSPAEFTDSGSMLQRSRKIRFYPTRIQKNLLFKWFGVARFCFNTTVAYLRQPDTKANWYEIKTEILNNLPAWAKDVPYQIKSVAIRDACEAVKLAKRKYKLTGKLCRVKFRSRKLGDFNLYIPKSSVNATGFYTTFLGELNLRELVGNVDFDCRVVLENNRFFLTKPEAKAIKIPENQRIPVIALDPGVRAFQTIYSPEIAGKVGHGDFQRIYRLCYTLDALYSGRKKQRTNRFNRKLKRLRWKIKDLIAEVHHKLALFLVKNFEVILIPSFETSEMVTKLHSKVARAMLGWAHYRFKSFLKCKAQEYSAEVIEVNEAYTSRTCTRCGKQQNIGSKKVFICSCGLVLDRDLLGARNIFLKNVSLATKDPSMKQTNGSLHEPLLIDRNIC